MAGAEMCTFDPHVQNMHRDDLELLLDTSWSRCVKLSRAMKDRGIKQSSAAAPSSASKKDCGDILPSGAQGDGGSFAWSDRRFASADWWLRPVSNCLGTIDDCPGGSVLFRPTVHVAT
ncbi:hypothetical protein [Lentzea indica]|uniref:hypothetical protein n=1 Tax=Lentzea indica TaxID=2604800 RepID=UPI00165F0EFC|nr:hypothetical protein [Lentzea indica]